MRNFKAGFLVGPALMAALLVSAPAWGQPQWVGSWGASPQPPTQAAGPIPADAELYEADLAADGAPAPVAIPRLRLTNSTALVRYGSERRASASSTRAGPCGQTASARSPSAARPR